MERAQKEAAHHGRGGGADVRNSECRFQQLRASRLQAKNHRHLPIRRNRQNTTEIALQAASIEGRRGERTGEASLGHSGNALRKIRIRASP